MSDLLEKTMAKDRIRRNGIRANRLWPYAFLSLFLAVAWLFWSGSEEAELKNALKSEPSATARQVLEPNRREPETPGPTPSLDDKVPVPAVTVHGFISRLGGSPAVGVSVNAARDNEGLCSVLTDERGFYSILVPLQGESVEITPTEAGWASIPPRIRISPRDTAQPRMVRNDFYMRAAGTLLGYVYSQEGTALSGVKVVFSSRRCDVLRDECFGESPRTWPHIAPPVLTTSDGRFESDQLPLDEAFCVVAMREGLLPEVSERFVLSAGAPQEVELTMCSAACLTGSVRFDDGTAVREGRLSYGLWLGERVIVEGEFRTSRDGGFSLDGLPPGHPDSRIEGCLAGASDAERLTFFLPGPWRQGRTVLDITLSREPSEDMGGKERGAVHILQRDAKGRRQNLRLGLTCYYWQSETERPPIFRRQRARANEAVFGCVLVKGVPYDVLISDAYGVVKEWKGITADDRVLYFEIGTRPEGSTPAGITGTVMDADGGPLRGVTVRLAPPFLERLPYTRIMCTILTQTTDDDGGFGFANLVPGEYEVHAAGCILPCTLEPGDTIRVELYGEAPGGLRGKVYGIPESTRTRHVTLCPVTPRLRCTQSPQLDASGEFQVDNVLPPGRYRVTFVEELPFEREDWVGRIRHGCFASKEVEIVSRDTAFVELDADLAEYFPVHIEVADVLWPEGTTALQSTLTELSGAFSFYVPLVRGVVWWLPKGCYKLLVYGEFNERPFMHARRFLLDEQYGSFFAVPGGSQVLLGR